MIRAGVLIAFCLTACITQPVSRTPPTASVLKSSAQCGHDLEAGKADWLDDAAGLRAVYAALHRQQLGAPASHPEVDFRNYGVVAVFLGRKPTAGYSLSLSDPQISISNKTAELRLVFATPAPGGLSAQVMTSPCILIKVPRIRQTTLRIVDQHGGLRHEIKPQSN